MGSPHPANSDGRDQGGGKPGGAGGEGDMEGGLRALPGMDGKGLRVDARQRAQVEFHGALAA
ncbi:hypothetical protein B1218_34710, partial [Pseudomonas ogarae]